MADSSREKSGFIKQAGILAVAGILSRVIGLLYNSPMTAIIGDEGNGYYEYAYKAYTIVLLISSYSIPSAISKVIAQRLAAHEYRNAHKVFKGALIYVTIVGGAASLLLFLLADQMVNLSNSVTVLRFFAPTIFLSGIMGVLRGYFQAHRSMVQTSVSQIIEQFVNALVSIWLAYILTGIASAASAADNTERAVYGAVGGAIGTGMGVVAGLIFMGAVYGLNRNILRRRIERDKTPEEESYGSILKMILLVVTPFILSTFIYNINTFLNQTIFNQAMLELKDMTEAGVSALNSAIGKATKISNIPIAISTAMSSALIPGIAGDFSQGRTQLCREKVSRAIRTTMYISIPAAVGIGVLARPIMAVLYPQPEVLELSSYLLTAMSAGVILYSLSTLSSAVLQGIGRINSPVINATIALIIQTIILIATLFFTDMGIYAMAAAVVFYALLMCILNAISVRKHLQYRQEWNKTFLRPLLAAVVMGVVSFASYHAIYYLSSLNIVSLIVAVAAGVTVYFILTILWKAVGEEELSWLPGSISLVRFLNGTRKTSPKSSQNSKRKAVPDNKDYRETHYTEADHEEAYHEKEDYVESDYNEEDYWLDD